MTLKEYRLKNGLTQKQLADAIGVEKSMISRYENGHVIPAYKHLTKLIQVLSITLEDCEKLEEQSIGHQISKDKISINAKHQPESFLRRLLILASNGKCELCEEKAPFNDSEGRPYLEIYNIANNTKSYSVNDYVTLCPNCFAKLQILKNESDIEKLKILASNHNF